MNEDLFKLFETAKQAASSAAAVHRRAMNAGNPSVDTKASTFDLVTQID
jgi:hypothetical protein